MSSLALIAVGLAVVAALFVAVLYFMFLLVVGLCLVPLMVLITAAADHYHEWRRSGAPERRKQAARRPALHGG